MASDAFQLPPPSPSLSADMPGRRAVRLAEVTGDVVDLAVKNAGLIARTGPSHYLPDPKFVGWLAWEWKFEDTSRPPVKRVLAEGRAWTKKRARLRQRKAYTRDLIRLERVNAAHAEALLEDAEREGACEGCPDCSEAGS